MCEVVALVSLGTRVLRGGLYLVLRQGLGIAIGVVGVTLLTRATGPGAYSLYVAALRIYSYLTMVGRWRVHVYLVRREGEPQAQDYHQAFSLLLLLGLAAAQSAILVLPSLEGLPRGLGTGGCGSVCLAPCGSTPTGAPSPP